MKPPFIDFAGNERLRTQLSEDILHGRISHAYVLEGTFGAGKHMLATRIAAAIACERKSEDGVPHPCMECPACRKILEGNSPDLIFLNRGDKATFGVDAVRPLKADVLIPPNELPAKIYVLEDAHLLTTQAQNALLLTLEEPPPYVLFLLLCNTADTLLETVRSRAPIYRLERLDPAVMHTHLCKVSTDASLLARNDPTAFSELLFAANGALGQALLLLDEKRRRPVIERRRLVRDLLHLLSARHSASEAYALLQSLPSKRENLTLLCNEILLALRDLLVLKQSDKAPLCFFSDREEAELLAYRRTSPELLQLMENTNRAIDELSANANVRLTTANLAVRYGLL